MARLPSTGCSVARKITIRTEVDYKKALAEVEELWGSKRGTVKGDRLDALATLINAYEDEHYPMDTPNSAKT